MDGRRDRRYGHANGFEEYQRRIQKYSDTVMRVSVMFFLDFLLNETFPAFFIQCFQMLSSQSNGKIRLSDANLSTSSEEHTLNSASSRKYFEFEEIIFSSNRLDAQQLWSQLSWPAYLLISGFYYYAALSACYLLYTTTSQLLQFYRWFCPVLVLFSHFLWSVHLTYINNNHSDEVLEPHFLVTLFTMVATIVLRLLIAQASCLLYERWRLKCAENPNSDPLVNELKCLIEFYCSPLCFTLPFYVPVALSLLLRVFSYLFSYNMSTRTVVFGLLICYAPIICLEVVVYVRFVLQQSMDCFLCFLRARDCVQNFGTLSFLTQEWERLDVPSVLRVFLLSRVLLHGSFLGMMLLYPRYDPANGAQLIPNAYYRGGSYPGGTIQEATMGGTLWQQISYCIDYMLARSTETVVALGGMTSLVSTVGHFIGVLFQLLLPNADDERNAGGSLGMVFFILALQTGITGLSAEKRLTKLYRNFGLIFTAALHFVHQMTNHVLLTLSTTGNFAWSRHLRALTVCFILVGFPALLLHYIWSTNKLLNPWIASVTIFALEVIVKVIVSVLLYCASLKENLGSPSHHQDSLDDLIFFVKAAGGVLEFLFGVLLFFNGLWVLCVENGGLIRAFMICVHVYANIWRKATSGWQRIKRRANAMLKLAGLESPSTERLAEIDDVCSICYVEMSGIGNEKSMVKMTKCRHCFHYYCLRKWLYINDTCPLCHSKLFPSRTEPAPPRPQQAN